MRVNRRRLIRRWIEDRTREFILLNEIAGHRIDYLEVRRNLVHQLLLVELYLPSRRVPRQRCRWNTIMTTYDDERFQSLVGLLKSTFLKLARQLKESDRFGERDQIPVELQLGITLYRLRSSSENLTKVASIFGIEDLTTIQTITKRVFDAITDLSLIAWPTAAEKMRLIADSQHTLPFCLGIVDATQSPLKYPPTFNPNCFLTNQSKYAVKWQVICDLNKTVRHSKAVLYGSSSDSFIYQRSRVYQRSDSFFSGNEYIIGDFAYPLTSRCLTPYRANSRAVAKEQGRMFNKILMTYHSRVKECISEIKGRFPSLNMLPLKIDTEADLSFCSSWVSVAVAVHNFAKAADEDNEQMNRVGVNMAEVVEREDVMTGEQRRLWLLQKLMDNERNDRPVNFIH